MSIETLAARVQYLGGNNLGRLKRQKLNSLRAALKNSYNSRLIKTPLHDAFPALITDNTSGLKSDYDKKYLSIEFSAGLEAGDSFTILDDGTVWMVYLPLLTETAYLRSEIIRCRYSVEVNGKKWPVYFQGPTETDLRWAKQNNVNYNELNLSGTIYIKNTEENKAFFHRFSRFKIDGHTWEVQVTDPLSVPGILELEVQEYYDNDVADLPQIKQEYTSGPEYDIMGKDVVKPNTTVGYIINKQYYNPDFSWVVKDNPRVEIEGVYEDGRMCKVFINPGTVHPFNLYYGDHVKRVLVDWEQPKIQGPEVVYPYDVHTYFVKDSETPVTFEVDDASKAKITSQDGSKCDIDIISSRSCSFILRAMVEDEEYAHIEVTVKSL